MPNWSGLAQLVRDAQKSPAADNSDRDDNQGAASRPQQKDPKAAEDSEQQWKAVGAEAKRAVSSMESSKKAGEAPNYEAVGKVAKEALAAYMRDGERDLGRIGQQIAAGFMGGETRGAGETGRRETGK